ncbi:MAG: M24 family metallopeptidase, partial [Dehalococcoidia bacterium]|nr:M24 family metallopeptidase [Dehalococcoidia bacterium]
VEQAKQESPEFEIFYLKGEISKWLPALLEDCGIKRLGIEADYLSVSTYQSIYSIFKKTEHKTTLSLVKGSVESLRVIKDQTELECIKKAAKIADAAMNYAVDHLHTGITEKQFAWELECFMRQNGSDNIPFEIIVASGTNAAFPHAHPTDKIIVSGEPITIDLGARYNGYCSDMTRTFIIGRPDVKFDAIYNIVLSAQLTALSVIQSGMESSKADGLIRDMIDKAGYGDQFGHGLGHGLGIEIHESPRLGTLGTDILEDHMVFTIEPGIYLPGWGGIRIEDTVTLERGKLVCLTHSNKEALIQGG